MESVSMNSIEIQYFSAFCSNATFQCWSTFADSVIMIWKLNESAPPPNNIFAEDEQDNKESWSLFKILR